MAGPAVTTVALLVPLVLAGSVAFAGAQDTRPTRSRLAQPAVIDDVPCDAWYVWHFPNGRLYECRLSIDANVRGAKLPARTIVVFEPDGTFDYVFLPETTEIEGHAIRGHGHGWMTLLHANGRLKLGWLARRETIDGIPCDKATFLGEFFGRRYATTEFHPNGRLAACRLSGDVEVDGQRLRHGQRIELDPDGRRRGPAGLSDPASSPIGPAPRSGGARRPPVPRSR